MKKRTFKNYLSISLKGMAMGAADVVPGVSGGTIAFVMGIYQELIDSIKSVNIASVKTLLSGNYKGFWQAVNGNFLVALFVGILFSILSLAKLFKFLLENHPTLLWSFFFGLIVASAIFIAKKIDKWNFSTISSLIFGTAIAYFITVVTPAEPNEAYWFVFLSGAIAICAMILPGISGSFILVLLGMYKFILSALSDVNLAVIAVFASGALVGLLSFSNLLSYLMKRFYNQTVAVLTGFMVGSLNKVWPWKEVLEWQENRHGELVPFIEQNVLPQTFEKLSQGQFATESNEAFLFYAILLALFGFALVFLFEKFEKKEVR